MASSGKKGKGKKGKTVQLQEFLGENDAGTNSLTQVKKITSWADDYDDDEPIRRPQAYALPTAPRASRIMNEDIVPQNPPFLVSVANLPYESNESDLYELFEGLKIKSIKLSREDGDTGRLRGFGFIEFSTRDDLIEAVKIPDPVIKTRRIKVDLPTENDHKRMGGERSWRQKDRNDDNDGGGNRRGFSFRDREPVADGEMKSWRSTERPKDSPPPARRNNYSNDSYKRRGYDNRSRNEEPQEERPRLNIKPRTLPIEKITPVVEDDVEKKPKPAPVPAANIFGNAKPVDTAAREREIEERLEKERVAAIQAAKEAKEREKEKEVENDNAIDKEEEQKIESKPKKTEEVISWRKRNDDDDNINTSPQRKYSPARDYNRDNRRGGGNMRRNDRDQDRRDRDWDDRRGRDNDRDGDRRGYDRDYRPPRDNRDYNKDYRNDRDNRNNYSRDRDYRDNRNDRDYRDNRNDREYRDNRNDRYQNKQNRDNRNNRNDSSNRRDNRYIQNRDSDDGSIRDPEDHMPKYQPPSGPNLSMSNKYAAFMNEDDDEVASD